MQIAYLLLVHQHPDLVARLVRLLLASGGVVAIHVDLNCGAAFQSELERQIGDGAVRVLWAKRTRVAWGEWSITQATLNGLDAIAGASVPVDYVHLLSGADYPIRPLAEMARFLEANRGTEYIESVNIGQRSWVKIGPEHERYLYRHHLNWRRWPWLAQKWWQWQCALGLKRQLPKGLAPHLGSQWWTLTWATCERVMAAGRDAKLRRFFSTVAIPDEMFVQTLVRALVGDDRIASKSLTLSQFTDYGVPVVYCNDHAAYLARQAFFFARKISSHATGLRDQLDRHVHGEVALPQVRSHRFGQHSAEYEATRVARRQLQPGQRLVGVMPDAELGDLVAARPFVMLLGASREELLFVRDLLNAAGCLHCHGTLFAPDTIDFAGGGERLGIYHRSDTRLRDQAPMTFLADVLRHGAGGVPRGFLLPLGMEQGLRGTLLRAPGARPLVVRGNALRAFLEHRAVVTAMPEVIPDGEFAGAYATYRQYHEELAQMVAARPKGTAAELVLTDGDWLARLHEFIRAVQR